MAHGHGHDTMAVAPAMHGTIAEFDDPDALLAATIHARDAGYTHMEAYSPLPIHGLADALGFNDYRIPRFAFAGGLVGGLTGMFGLWYVSVIDYPLNVGGKPLFSWPQFIPVAYEATILFAAGMTFLACWALNGLPKVYHPVFNARNFDRASQDRFFLCIEVTDPIYDERGTAEFLAHQEGVLNVSEVEK
ncbi:MAG: DUF3341 domain-containing protein [Capsulimonadales bacterium]|nr:DUF3341 domain-containing protein [Capsulimonadales bacterium]